MDENKMNPELELDEEMEGEQLILTLEDEEGNTFEFVLYDEVVMDGQLYYALVPTDDKFDDAEGDYLILRVNKDGEEYSFENPEPDEEDKVAEYFDDKFFSDADYDA